jgi:hypothetical protein
LSLFNDNCLVPLSIHIPELEEETSLPNEILRIFPNDGIGKMTLAVRQNQRSVIEFLLLEGCEGGDIVLSLQNASG